MSVINKRKKIGLQLQHMGYGTTNLEWSGAVESAEDHDIDLVIFPGRSLDSPYGFDYQYNLVYEMMNKENIDALVLYTPLIGNFVGFETIKKICYGIKDIPVISVGIDLPGIPSLIIDNKAGIKDVVQHFVKEHQARRIAFVKGPERNIEAEARVAAFREEMIEQNLSIDENLIVQGDFTAFSVPAALDELLGKCGDPPEAIIFANDEMALRSIEYLQEKGFNVPKDIGISGFDDVFNCLISTPQLTSIRQPLNDVFKKAIETALDILEGKSVQEISVFPTSLSIRTSCGCNVESIKTLYSIAHTMNENSPKIREASSVYDCVAAFLSPKYLLQREDVILEMIGNFIAQNKVDDLQALQNFFQEILIREIRLQLIIKDWLHILVVISECLQQGITNPKRENIIQLKIRLCLLLVYEMNDVARNIETNTSYNSQTILRQVLGNLSSIVQMDDLIQALYSKVPLLEIHTFFLFAYDTPWSHEKKTPWDIPQEIKYIAGMIDNVPCGFRNKRDVLSTLNIFSDDFMIDTKNKTLLVYPLFFREVHYGIIILELSKKGGFIVEGLVSTISGVMKSASLYQSKERVEEKLRKTMLELEEHNEQLNNLSITDELTGLYNRRGFMKLAVQQHRLTMQMKKKALVIFLDVDGLKIINDVYGHEEGDWIIKKTAEVLKKTFRNMDIIARLGGDEFIVLTSNAGLETLGTFKNRMSIQIDKLNETSGKPFKLSISLGVSECGLHDKCTLDDYMRKADEELYKEKQSKKEARAKNGKES